MRSNFNKEQKQQIVEAFIQSGKSQTAFAPDYGIKANTLSNWVKKYRTENESSGVSFVELKSTVVTQNQSIKTSQLKSVKMEFRLKFQETPCQLYSEKLFQHWHHYENRF